ncbi:transposase [Nonomuraea turcica]|uniref:transposase n=1 Tax=Nonomuraea sp. G32 TaxID=3067274 RepID=UPI00273B832D|nr:transposase [Nonomuraea sp. G32]MDP4501093.1 transposase [Nonomuraea sp. G32]
MATWHGPEGIIVEPIILNDRPRLRVTQLVHGRRYLLDYCTNTRQVAQHVDLADLVEVIPLPIDRRTP